MTTPTFEQLYEALQYLKEEIERFNPRDYDSKRQMRRARGKWKAQRKRYWHFIL